MVDSPGGREVRYDASPKTGDAPEKTAEELEDGNECAFCSCQRHPKQAGGEGGQGRSRREEVVVRDEASTKEKEQLRTRYGVLRPPS